jgi:adenosylcobinamide kinase/adenosylcobinamide-phosphate guanylyltransferase
MQKEAFLEHIEGYPGPLKKKKKKKKKKNKKKKKMTRTFCDELGWLNQALAQRCQRVVMVLAGLPLTLKDSTPSLRS